MCIYVYVYMYICIYVYVYITYIYIYTVFAGAYFVHGIFSVHGHFSISPRQVIVVCVMSIHHELVVIDPALVGL